MFGYIIPEKQELRIREYEIFRSYYCAVCKSIGKRHGIFQRMSLSYDATFLALLISSLSGEPGKVKRERCIIHPFRKRNVFIADTMAIDYASDMNVILTYYNLLDKANDEKSVLPKGAALLFRKAAEKIRMEYPEKCGIIEKNLNDLLKIEMAGCPSMDEAAEPFAGLMEEVLLFPGSENGKNAEILRWIGYNLGKWIYIIDAYDDLEKDFRKNSYNPLICSYNGNNKGSVAEYKDYFRERVAFNLTYTLSEIAKAFELLDIKKNKPIIENIIYLGMLRKTEQILEIGSCSKIEESL